MGDQRFTISLFDNKHDVAPREKSCTWAGFMVSFQHPRVRAAKDGALFAPARFTPALHRHRHWKAKCPCATKTCVAGEFYPCEKACRNLECVAEVTMLVLDCDHDASIDAIESTLLKVGCTYAIYSTHSHRRLTDSNPQAEPRYRVVIPLSEPIPAAKFSELWQWARDLRGLTVDESAKDASRMFYTPAVASHDRKSAPYQFRGNVAEPLNWKAVLNAEDLGLRSTPAPIRATKTPAARSAAEHGDQASQSSVLSPNDFVWHEDRHEELCNRIMARGKQNGRGNFDARCLAHGGKGNTALCYFPRTGAVMCNKKCSYQALLAAESLSTLPLPSKDAAAARVRREELQRAASVAGSQLPVSPSRVLTVADVHEIYSVLLAHLLVITPHDEKLIREHWHCDPYGSLMVEHPLACVEHPFVSTENLHCGYPGCELAVLDHPDAARADGKPLGVHPPLPVKTCSVPSPLEAVIAANKLAEWFNLEGVAGFYRDVHLMPSSPTPYSQRERWHTREFGPWRIKIPDSAQKAGLLVPYTNDTEWILGIRVYRNVRDRVPTLLSSRGLPGGAKALPVREEVAA